MIEQPASRLSAETVRWWRLIQSVDATVVLLVERPGRARAIVRTSLDRQAEEVGRYAADALSRCAATLGYQVDGDRLIYRASQAY